MSQKNGHALESVTLTAMLRRWTSSLLLIAVTAASALSAMILQNLTIRQENALSSTIENTTISCTVTNAKGTDSGNLQMLSAFVEMLEGKRRLRECYLDDYVKNVRAKAKMSLEKPEGATLSRILSIDSDPALSQAEGVYVRFFEGWEEEDLRGQEQVCLISSDMFTDGKYITVAADMGESARLRIIGTVANGPSNEIYCPYFMSWSEGVSVAFLTDSCSFDIRNNQKLEESKSYIYEWFVRPDLSNHMKLMLEEKSDEEIRTDKIEILAELTRLRQLCCDPALLYDNYKGGSAKTELVRGLIRNAVENGHKVLLFSQFTTMLERLYRILEEEKIASHMLTGATPKEKRIEMVESFAHDEVPVFCISLKAGGTGLNLTAADVVIHFDPWWNSAVQNQATDRAHRIGQKNVVNVYRILAKGTIEEKIVELQERKLQLSDRILGGESLQAQGLTREELLELLR